MIMYGTKKTEYVIGRYIDRNYPIQTTKIKNSERKYRAAQSPVGKYEA